VEILKASFKEALKRVADQYIELDLTGAPLQQIKVLESNKVKIEWVKFIPNCHIFDNEGTLFIDLHPAGFYMGPASVFIVMKRVFTDKKNRRELINGTDKVLDNIRYYEGCRGGENIWRPAAQDRLLFLAELIHSGNFEESRSLLNKNDLILLEDHSHLLERLIIKMPKC